jgi:hypothetical protein
MNWIPFDIATDLEDDCMLEGTYHTGNAAKAIACEAVIIWAFGPTDRICLPKQNVFVIVSVVLSNRARSSDFLTHLFSKVYSHPIAIEKLGCPGVQVRADIDTNRPESTSQ